MLTFSVIIPTLNEAQRVEHCIQAVRALKADVEIIVADGGSTDRTREIAQSAGAIVEVTTRGRGIQCNAGTRPATGDVFLFLHADTRLPAGAFPLLQDYFQNLQNLIGAFRIRFTPGNWLLNSVARFSRFDTFLTTYGDQCIVVRRSFFNLLGGFPEWPLFEDVHFLQQARKHTRINKFPLAVTSSARRFQEGGSLRQLLRNGWLMMQYSTGVSPFQLAEQYERTRPEIQ